MFRGGAVGNAPPSQAVLAVKGLRGEVELPKALAERPDVFLFVGEKGTLEGVGE